ncbi:hypothetical protein D9M68_546610 [compost metagenome]
MNFSYLLAFFKSHPVSFSALCKAFLLTAALTFPLALMAIHNIKPQLAIDIINESRAPGTFQIICSIALLFLSAKVAISGPIDSLNDRIIKIFCVYFPNTALGIGAMYVGVAFSALIAAAVSFIPLPAPYTYTELLWQFISLFTGLITLYTLFVFLTVNETVSPGYRRPSFRPTMRVLSAIFFFTMLVRTVVFLSITLGIPEQQI